MHLKLGMHLKVPRASKGVMGVTAVYGGPAYGFWQREIRKPEIENKIPAYGSSVLYGFGC